MGGVHFIIQADAASRRGLTQVLGFMKRLPCPVCKAPAFTHGQKACLEPARAIRCSSCGAGVSVAAFPSMVIIVLLTFAVPFGFIGGMAFTSFFYFPFSFIVYGIIGGLIVSVPFALAYQALVPLVAKEP